MKAIEAFEAARTELVQRHARELSELDGAMETVRRLFGLDRGPAVTTDQQELGKELKAAPAGKRKYAKRLKPAASGPGKGSAGPVRVRLEEIVSSIAQPFTTVSAREALAADKVGRGLDAGKLSKTVDNAFAAWRGKGWIAVCDETGFPKTYNRTKAFGGKTAVSETAAKYAEFRNSIASKESD